MTVELEYLTKRGEVKREIKTAPLFQKTNDIWRKITVKNEDYYKLNFEIQNPRQMRFLFVKKKFFHQIDIKELKNLALVSPDKIEVEAVKKVLKSSYLWTCFQILLRENSAAQGTAQGMIPAQYLTAVYRILKKGKANLFPIFFTYFLRFGERKNGEQSANFAADFKFSMNTKMILSFEFFLSLLTKKSESREEVLSCQWDEASELFRLRDRLRLQDSQRIVRHRKAFVRFLKNGRENFADMVCQDGDYSEFFWFQVMSALCYFSNINSMESVIKFADLIKKNAFFVPAEILKGVLTKRGIELENEIVALLLK